MEATLSLSQHILPPGVQLRYVLSSSDSDGVRDSEIDVKMEHLYACPDEARVLRALEKKVSRIDAFKNQKYIVPLCILLLLSHGYTVNSTRLDGISDALVERCWECILLVSHNIPVHVSTWMTAAMAGRSQVGYAALFCQGGQTLSTLATIQNLPAELSFQAYDRVELDLPDVIWHRDDVVFNTLLAHTAQFTRTPVQPQESL